MKKTTANKKVLKAMSIGLAAMMGVLSAPVNALADDTVENNDNVNTGSSKNVSDAASGVEGVSEAAGNISIESVQSAADEVNAAEFENNQVSVDSMYADINGAKNDLSEADKSVNSAKTNTENGDAMAEAADTAATDAVNNAGTIINAADKFEEKVDDAEKKLEEANAALGNAGTVAEVDKIVDEAREAVNEAITECDETKAEYEAAKKAYEEAIASVDASNAAAVETYNKARADYEKAALELVEATEKLQSAKNAADEIIKKADEQKMTLKEAAENAASAVESANSAVEEAKKAVDDIKGEIDKNKAIVDTVFNQKNTLEDLIEAVDKKPNNSTIISYWRGADKLAEAVIKYNIAKETGINPESIEVSKFHNKTNIGIGNYAVVSYKNADDNTVYRFFDYSAVTKDGDIVVNNTIKDTADIAVFEKKVSADWVITGVDNNGNVQIEGKNGKTLPTFADMGSLENSYKSNTILDENNELNASLKNAETAHGEKLEAAKKASDDKAAAENDYILANEAYTKLVEATEKTKAEVINAQNAVTEAEKKIADIKAEIEKKAEDVVKPGYAKELELLKENLKKAEEKLEVAEVRKNALEEKLISLERASEEKKRDIERIAAAESTGSTTTTVTTATVTAIPTEVYIAEPAVTTAAETEAMVTERGVAGARVSETLLQASDINATSSEENIEDEANVTESGMIKKPDDDTQETVTIKDDAVPLASLPEEAGKKMNIWWILMVALFGAAGEEMYRRSRKNKAGNKLENKPEN